MMKAKVIKWAMIVLLFVILGLALHWSLYEAFILICFPFGYLYAQRKVGRTSGYQSST